MTTQTKWVVISMLLLPFMACLGVAIAANNGVWNPYSATYTTVFVMNLIVVLVGAVISWLLLRRAEGNLARWTATLPTIGPSIYGTFWYLGRALFPAEVAPGAEYIGAPQYLIISVFGLGIIVLLLRVTGLVSRTP
ncbi:MAG: hypothetical protein VYA80_00875 [Pseudomonadota bacterium]|nr:hypothetical protein [Pseudomonadota bacterium]